MRLHSIQPGQNDTCTALDDDNRLIVIDYSAWLMSVHQHRDTPLTRYGLDVSYTITLGLTDDGAESVRIDLCTGASATARAWAICDPERIMLAHLSRRRLAHLAASLVETIYDDEAEDLATQTHDYQRYLGAIFGAEVIPFPSQTDR